MKELKAEAVKKLEVGSSVWIRKKGTDKKSEFRIVQYGKEKRLIHVLSGSASAPRPIRDRMGFCYEVEI